MKKILGLLIAISVVFLSVRAVYAQGMRNRFFPRNKGLGSEMMNQVGIAGQDSFASGDTVNVTGNVTGDVYVAGGDVTVDGTVGGDVLAVGGTVRVTGSVNGNVRAAGGTVIIDGRVGRNVTAFGGEVSVSGNGTVQGGLVTGAGDVTIDGSIGQNITAATGSITVGSGAAVGGDLNYWSGKQAVIAQNAQIGGSVNFHESKSSGMPKNTQWVERVGANSRWMGSLATFILGLMGVFIFPAFFKKTDETLSSRPLGSLGIGCLAVLVLPVLILGLIMTILGIPLAILIVVFAVLVFYLSRIVAIHKIGSLVMQRVDERASGIWVFSAGMLVYLILMFIPVIRGIVGPLSALMGFGAVILSRKKSDTKPSGVQVPLKRIRRTGRY
jgi:hypothetical protein